MTDRDGAQESRDKPSGEGAGARDGGAAAGGAAGGAAGVEATLAHDIPLLIGAGVGAWTGPAGTWVAAAFPAAADDVGPG